MANEDPGFNSAAAHRHFSAECFNRTWELIERPNRTPEEDEAMILCASASLWHWTQRSDRTNLALSIGHWQLSRALALAGHGDAAMRHALRSLQFAEDAAPFYVGYSHEAAARAALILKDHPRFRDHLKKAKSLASAIAGPDEQALIQDLRELEQKGLT